MSNQNVTEAASEAIAIAMRHYDNHDAKAGVGAAMLGHTHLRERFPEWKRDLETLAKAIGATAEMADAAGRRKAISDAFEAFAKSAPAQAEQPAAEAEEAQ